LGSFGLGFGHRKHVSDKKLSTRKRGVFRDKRHRTARILSCGGTLPLPSGEVRGHEPSGLEFSKAGCCVFTDDVVCSSGYTDKCFECSTYKWVMQEMEDEDRKFDAEVLEMHRTGVHPP
jgi:hypothetical protein